jgi:hypothetical protein
MLAPGAQSVGVDHRVRTIGVFGGLGKDRCDVHGEIYAQPSPSFHFRMDDVLCVLCNAYGSPRGPPPRGVPLRRQGKVPSVGMIAAAYWRLTSRAETVPRVLGVGPNCAIPPLAMSAPRRSVVPGSIIKALIDEIHC